MMTKNQEFFRKINHAFMTGDVDTIYENMTEDITWNMVGNTVIEGKEAVIKEMEPMRGFETEHQIKEVITHGNMAVIEGTMTMDENGGNKKYAFCDIYKLNKHKDGKIKEITAYLIEIE
ncbi:nuclear transport factor 2 family protein [Oceanobacillus manasiensis]|uniref:nuclear transport factor 2 family protein n=1 Tax=Oceanobacillus manasiensis TaxID=586413 RepID=UPI0005A633B5|nr:nuclear transport factor 2 family protein [Oceanobacillus manasiensis]